MAEKIVAKHRLLAGLGAEDSSKDPLLSIYLSQAEKKVIKTRHPFGATDTQKSKALIDYEDNVDSIYVYLWNKQGAEGETSHNENGINRSYESAGIPSSFLSDIVPIVKMF